ncbi:hypothetical protein CS915_015925 [Enterococcus faecium]|nr:hypothetical protein CS915_015925 [Enterococcus faecium]
MQQNQDTPLNIQSYCIKCYYIHSNCIHKKKSSIRKKFKRSSVRFAPTPLDVLVAFPSLRSVQAN